MFQASVFQQDKQLYSIFIIAEPARRQALPAARKT